MPIEKPARMSNLPAPIALVVLLVLALLIVASGLCVWRQHRVPERDDTELRQRIRSWWWMIGLLFAALLFSRWTALCFFALLSYLALKEFFSIVPTRLIDRRVLFWAYLTVPLQYLWIGLDWTTMAITFIPVYALLWLPVRLVLLGEPDGFIRSAGVIFWMVMLAVYGLSHLGGLVMLPVSDLPAGYAGPVLFLILMTQSNDVAQYVWGRSFGRRQVVPAISPGKTWGGLWGGVATLVLASMLLGPWLTVLSWPMSALAGGLIALSGFLGDVVMSAVKRDLKLKDTGRMIPGHGGILDRLDSLLFTAPIFFHFYVCVSSGGAG